MQKQRDLDQLVQSVAESGDKLSRAERRSFLKHGMALLGGAGLALSLIHISEPTRLWSGSRMPSSA